LTLNESSGYYAVNMTQNPFETVNIRGVSIRNRFIAAPMATQYPDKFGHVTETQIAYYKHLALTGVGMVIVEAAMISPEGRGWSRELEAHTPEARVGLAGIADIIRQQGSVPFLQLHHAGRQALPTRDNWEVVAPSPVPCPILDRPVKALTYQEIKDLVRKFAESARIANDAGFAGIELHGAHGYLLHQFVSPLTNFREDEYGLQRNCASKFPLEVVQLIRSEFPKLAIIYRHSVRDYLPKGLTLSSSVIFAKALEGAGVDMIHVSGGMYASLHGSESIVGPATPLGIFRDDARDIREAVNIPVAVVGKIQYPAMAFEILSNNDANFIALGRMLLRDPEWIQKARGLNKAPVEPCLLCARCRYHVKGCPDGSGKSGWLEYSAGDKILNETHPASSS